MLRYALAGTGVAALLAGTAMPGQAATAIGTADATADFSLFLPEGSTLELDPPVATENLVSQETAEGDAFAEAGGDTSVGVDGGNVAEGELTPVASFFLQSDDRAEAGPGLGQAAALTTQQGTISLFNPGEAEQSFNYWLDWSIDAEATIEGPRDFATAFAAVSLLGPDDQVIFSESLQFGGAEEYGSGDAMGTFIGNRDGGLFTVAGGDTLTLTVLTEGETTASVIPLPAALPLMLTAFGGLVALRRYQRRA